MSLTLEAIIDLGAFRTRFVWRYRGIGFWGKWRENGEWAGSACHGFETLVQGLRNPRFSQTSDFWMRLSGAGEGEGEKKSDVFPNIRFLGLLQVAGFPGDVDGVLEGVAGGFGSLVAGGLDGSLEGGFEGIG